MRTPRPSWSGRSLQVWYEGALFGIGVAILVLILARLLIDEIIVPSEDRIDDFISNEGSVVFLFDDIAINPDIAFLADATLVGFDFFLYAVVYHESLLTMIALPVTGVCIRIWHGACRRKPRPGMAIDSRPLLICEDRLDRGQLTLCEGIETECSQVLLELGDARSADER